MNILTIIAATHVIVTITCKHCLTMYEIVVSRQGLIDYKNGMLIQKAFPELSASERELILNATCGKCWDKMFLPPEQDDPYDDPSINDNLEQT